VHFSLTPASNIKRHPDGARLRTLNTAVRFLALSFRKYGISILGKMSNSDRKNENKPKKKESILELNKYLEKAIRVKFQGGREASGILKG